MGTGYVIGLLLLSAFTLLAQILVIIKTKRPTGRSARLAKLALSLSLSFIAMTTFIGSALTIAREARSEYLAFNKSEVEATDYITRAVSYTHLDVYKRQAAKLGKRGAGSESRSRPPRGGAGGPAAGRVRRQSPPGCLLQHQIHFFR